MKTQSEAIDQVDFDVEGIYHIYPTDDLRDHESSANCWCKPQSDENDRLFIHNSMDGREKFETGERKYS